MSRSLNRQDNAIDTTELQAVLESALSRHFGAVRRISRFERCASPYRTSFALEDIAVDLDDGTSLRLVFKNLGWAALHERAIHAKPRMLHDPLREIETYRTILAPARVGAPTYYGSSVDPQQHRYWLFIEHVSGWTLFEVESDIWPQAARWLASMHTHFTGDPSLSERAEAAHLLRYDADFYRMWPRRAQAFARFEVMDDADQARAALQRIVQSYDQVIDRLVELPPTFIHGEFFASNVLIETRGTEHRVCPIDWEMAAIGPGLIDLAALISGNWTQAERHALVLEYYQALGDGPWKPSFNDLLTSVAFCQLHIALQWVGWSQEWSPPPEHTQNWLAEALRLGNALGL